MGPARINNSGAVNQQIPAGESSRSQGTERPSAPQATQPSAGPTQGGSSRELDDHQRNQLQKQLNKQRTPNTRPAIPAPASGAGGVSIQR